MPDEKDSIIQQMQEKLMSDIMSSFDLLTSSQREELIKRLQKDFCLSCGDDRRVNNLLYGCKK